jgi:hypothetical protein
VDTHNVSNFRGKETYLVERESNGQKTEASRGELHQIKLNDSKRVKIATSTTRDDQSAVMTNLPHILSQSSKRLQNSYTAEYTNI